MADIVNKFLKILILWFCLFVFTCGEISDGSIVNQSGDKDGKSIDNFNLIRSLHEDGLENKTRSIRQAQGISRQRRPSSSYHRRSSYRRPLSSHHKTSSSHRKPSSSYRRPSSSLRRTSSSYRRPSSSYRRPSSSLRRTPSSYRSPSSRYRRPSSSLPRTSSSYRRPLSSYGRPSSSYRRPSSSLPRTSSSYRRPSSSLPRTSSSYRRPSTSLRRTSSSYRRPSSSLRRTSSSYRRPSSSLPRTSSSYRRPSSSLPRTSSSYRRPSTSLRRTSSSYRRPSSSLRRTSSSYRRPSSSLPRTSSSYRRPSSSYRRPTSSYRRPSSSLPRTSSSYRRPSSSLPRTSSSYRRPSTSLRRTSSSYRRPSSSLRRTSSSYRRPSSSLPRTSSSYRRPSSSYRRPTSSYRRPSSSLPRTSSSYRRPSSSLPRTSSSYRRPSSSYRRPSSSYRRPSSLSRSRAPISNGDPCDKTPCKNNGICRKNPGSKRPRFQCACPLGFRGRLCEDVMGRCDRVECQITKDCILTPEGAICICVVGIAGRLCRMNLEKTTQWEKLKTVISAQTLRTGEAVMGTIIGVMVLIFVYLVVHFCRVATKRRDIRERYAGVLHEGKVPTDLPPDIWDISNDVFKRSCCCGSETALKVDFSPRKSSSQNSIRSSRDSIKAREDALTKLLNSNTSLISDKSLERLSRPSKLNTRSSGHVSMGNSQSTTNRPSRQSDAELNYTLPHSDSDASLTRSNLIQQSEYSLHRTQSVPRHKSISELKSELGVKNAAESRQKARSSLRNRYDDPMYSDYDARPSTASRHAGNDSQNATENSSSESESVSDYSVNHRNIKHRGRRSRIYPKRSRVTTDVSFNASIDEESRPKKGDYRLSRRQAYEATLSDRVKKISRNKPGGFGQKIERHKRYIVNPVLKLNKSSKDKKMRIDQVRKLSAKIEGLRDKRSQACYSRNTRSVNHSSNSSEYRKQNDRNERKEEKRRYHSTTEDSQPYWNTNMNTNTNYDEEHVDVKSNTSDTHQPHIPNNDGNFCTNNSVSGKYETKDMSSRLPYAKYGEFEYPLNNNDILKHRSPSNQCRNFIKKEDTFEQKETAANAKTDDHHKKYFYKELEQQSKLHDKDLYSGQNSTDQFRHGSPTMYGVFSTTVTLPPNKESDFKMCVPLTGLDASYIDEADGTKQTFEQHNKLGTDVTCQHPEGNVQYVKCFENEGKKLYYVCDENRDETNPTYIKPDDDIEVIPDGKGSLSVISLSKSNEQDGTMEEDNVKEYFIMGFAADNSGTVVGVTESMSSTLVDKEMFYSP